jgi:hypothetical protein
MDIQTPPVWYTAARKGFLIGDIFKTICSTHVTLKDIKESDIFL